MINLRYKDIIPSLEDTVFHIFGCGAIGSAAAIQLTRMGAVNFLLYDMDKIEIHNVGVSNYDHKHIGEKKTIALRMQMQEINPILVNIQCLNKKVNNSTIMYMSGNDIAILGFDNMEARHDAVHALYKSNIRPKVVIDGRMGAEHYQQTTTKSLNDYIKTWYHDSEGDPEPCTAKATSNIRKIITNQPYSKKFSFHFPTMMLDYKRQRV